MKKYKIALQWMGKSYIKYYNDYTRMVSEAKYKSIHGEGLKI